MLMAISKTNLFEESFNLIKTFIENHIPDPKNIYKRKWIYSSMPDITSNSFSGFPFLIITSTDVSQESRDFNTGRGNVYRCLITVWSNEESEVDELSSDIYNILISNEDELNGLNHPEVSSSPFNMVLDQNGKKLYNRPIGIIAKGWV